MGLLLKNGQDTTSKQINIIGSTSGQTLTISVSLQWWKVDSALVTASSNFTGSLVFTFDTGDIVTSTVDSTASADNNPPYYGSFSDTVNIPVGATSFTVTIRNTSSFLVNLDGSLKAMQVDSTPGFETYTAPIDKNTVFRITRYESDTSDSTFTVTDSVTGTGFILDVPTTEEWHQYVYVDIENWVAWGSDSDDSWMFDQSANLTQHLSYPANGLMTITPYVGTDHMTMLVLLIFTVNGNNISDFSVRTMGARF